ncbi:hypothetical protein ASE35_00880 [Lysobacter sp. Root916]|nr:hypothetical protein ASE35_00880 [Lysobacter sp. Root916]
MTTKGVLSFDGHYARTCGSVLKALDPRLRGDDGKSRAELYQRLRLPLRLRLRLPLPLPLRLRLQLQLQLQLQLPRHLNPKATHSPDQP